MSKTAENQAWEAAERKFPSSVAGVNADTLHRIERRRADFVAGYLERDRQATTVTDEMVSAAMQALDFGFGPPVEIAENRNAVKAALEAALKVGR